MTTRSWFRRQFTSSFRPSSHRGPSRRMRPTVMALEGRMLLSTTIHVNNFTDSPVTGQTDLRQAITQANSDAAGDTIVFDLTTPQTIPLGSMLPIITSDLTINGPGENMLTISGQGSVRIFFVNQGNVSFSNMTLANGRARGGTGGGGGAGMGGALFVNGLYNGSQVTTSVTLNNVAFTGNQAVGGNHQDGTGGGGLGGSGGIASGGGGGFAGNGAEDASGGGFSGNATGEDGGSGSGSPFGGPAAQNGFPSTDGFTGFPGGGVGGGGGEGGFTDTAGGTGGNGGNGGIGGGGGGGGPVFIDSATNVAGGNGGDGGDFGGGGGGGLGIEGTSGNGGNGGFGGGGGSASFGSRGRGKGGNGGLGGGGADGSFPSSGGAGGSFGGSNGGGAGLGGAVFVRSGTLTVNGCSFTNNTATGGSGNENGQGKGGALFLITSDLASEAGVATAPTLVLQGFNAFSGDLAANQAGTATDNEDVYGATVVPTITQLPSSQTVTAFSSVSFTAAANTDSTTTVQWQVSTDGGATFSPINGATSTTLTLNSNSVTVNMTGDEYRAVFTGSTGSATTRPATLTVTKASPSITTSQQPASATVGTSIADQATVSGGANSTGTVTFNLYNNNSASGTPLFTDTESLSNGTATSKGFPTTTTGTDYWVATYNGDSNNNPVSSGNAAEPVSITPASPTITTTAGPTVVVGSGAELTDSATLAGGFNPTGTITFTLTLNGTTVDTEMATVSGSGSYSTPTGYLPTAAGTYQWVASYGGDASNNPVASTAGSEPEAVSPATPSISTSPQPASATVNSSIADKATVSGGFNPTGTVAFNLYNNSTATGTPLFTDTNEPLSGGVATSKGYTATVAGTDYWVATYNGDSNNNPVTSGANAEPVTITPGAPASITEVSGSPQSTTVGQPFTSPLVVVVKDTYGNLVPGASVTFAAPTSAPPPS